MALLSRYQKHVVYGDVFRWSRQSKKCLTCDGLKRYKIFIVAGHDDRTFRILEQSEDGGPEVLVFLEHDIDFLK